MIIDSFMFGLEYELDLLDIRLHYLNDIVDYFILVETDFTQRGDTKELYFEKNKLRFNKFINKIVHIKVEGFPKELPDVLSAGKVNWKYENFQRNQIISGIDKLNLYDSSTIIISDLDEIPSKYAIQQYSGINTISCVQNLYYYYLNLKSTTPWNGSVITTKKQIMGRSIQSFRDSRNVNKKVFNGGWHFSYTGGISAISNKLSSVCENTGYSKDVTKQKFNNFINPNSQEILSKVDTLGDKDLDNIILNKYKHLMLDD